MAQDDFNCCGGNDATPQEHTQDCWRSIARFVRIETAARALIKRPTSKAALLALEKALSPIRVDSKVP